MFTEDTREKLLKEIVRREVREQQGVDLEDLLNPIKAWKSAKPFAHIFAPPDPLAIFGFASKKFNLLVKFLSRLSKTRELTGIRLPWLAGHQSRVQDPQARSHPGGGVKCGGARSARGGAGAEARGACGGEAGRDA